MEFIEAHGPRIGLYTALQVVTFIGLRQLLPKALDDRIGVARDLLMCLVLPAMTFTAFRATYDLCGSVDDRFTGITWYSTEFQRIYIAANAFQTMIDIVSPQPFMKKIPMLVHHVASIFCYCLCLGLARMHFYACWDGMCEATTPFLMVVNIGRSSGGDFAQRFKDRMGFLMIVNGAGLWLSYIFFRVLLFPSWMIAFFVDIKSLPAHIWSTLTLTELLFYPATTLFLFGLSMIWFLRIHAGVIKLLSGKPTTRDD